jgi:hypothetical protein
MPSVFENLSDGFYTAFFEPDVEKRKAAIEVWVKAAALAVQPVVEVDIRRYLQTILTKDLDDPRGYQIRAEKFTRIMDTYKLCLDVTIRRVNRGKDEIVEPLSPEVRARTLEAARIALPVLLPKHAPLKPPTIRSSNQQEEDDYDDRGDHDRTPNDDRSDSMNPNNDEYHAAMDNHADQMNPNNDAYWSSRGR